MLWELGEEEGFFPLRGFGVLAAGEDCHNSFSPSFLVSYSQARKEACGLRQCQTPFWSPANCKEEGRNQNRKGKAGRRMGSHPFVSWGLRLPTEQFLSAPLPLCWVCFDQRGVMNWWSLARYRLLICLVLGSRMVSIVLVQTHHDQWASLGGQGLGVHFLRCCRTTTSVRKAHVPLGEAKPCSAPAKIACLAVCWGSFSLSYSSGTNKCFECCLRLVVFVKSSGIRRQRPLGVWVTSSLVEMHPMHTWWLCSVVCWSQLLENKYGWKQDNEFSCVRVWFLSCLWTAWSRVNPRACPTCKCRVWFFLN